MIKRIATAVVLIPIVLLLVLRAPVFLVAIVTGAVALVTVHEFLKLTEAYGVQPLRKPTYGFVALFFLLLPQAVATRASVATMARMRMLGRPFCARVIRSLTALSPPVRLMIRSIGLTGTAPRHPPIRRTARSLRYLEGDVGTLHPDAEIRSVQIVPGQWQ